LNGKEVQKGQEVVWGYVFSGRKTICIQAKQAGNKRRNILSAGTVQPERYAAHLLRRLLINRQCGS